MSIENKLKKLLVHFSDGMENSFSTKFDTTYIHLYCREAYRISIGDEGNNIFQLEHFFYYDSCGEWDINFANKTLYKMYGDENAPRTNFYTPHILEAIYNALIKSVRAMTTLQEVFDRLTRYKKSIACRTNNKIDNLIKQLNPEPQTEQASNPAQQPINQE